MVLVAVLSKYPVVLNKCPPKGPLLEQRTPKEKHGLDLVGLRRPLVMPNFDTAVNKTKSSLLCKSTFDCALTPELSKKYCKKIWCMESVVTLTTGDA